MARSTFHRFLAKQWKNDLVISSIVVLLMICCIERTSSSKTDVLGKSENNGCSAVKIAFGNKGMDGNMVPQSTLPGRLLFEIN